MKKWLPYHLAFCCFISWSCSLSAAKIQGIILSKEQKPLADVELILVQSQESTFTDDAGRFVFENIAAGDYDLVAFLLGYESVKQSIKLSAKEDLELSFRMAELSEQLNTVTIAALKDNDFGITRLKAVEGAAIYAGRKSEVVLVEDMTINKATNNSRQLYAKVSGLNIWENDGAGIQLGIGGRGLNPSRVSNFNTRQNGYDISADALGYPESYYSPPAEAIERIEIVRGAASLQYGTQFGGFLNFRLKSARKDTNFEVLSRQTVGSFGLFNSFNSVGGNKGKLSYYGYYQYKGGEGWRPNSAFDVHSAHANLQYAANKRLTIGLEYTFMHYLAQQAGGLTDALFEADPRQSIRDRNWFQVNWNLIALKLNYKINSRTELDVRNFGLLAGRDALGILGVISRMDDPSVERDLLSDRYRNFGHESRLIHQYEIGGRSAVFLVGVRYYQGFTNRKQGNASTGSAAEFEYLRPDNLEHSEYDFPSRNLSFFAENVFFLNPKLSLTPGLRFEHIHTESEGYYNNIFRNLAGDEIARERIEDNRNSTRSFFLAGLGLSYKPHPALEVYGNISQNYRSINFNDMRIVNPNYQVDVNLQDERGYSIDLGARGNVRNVINYDVSLFLLRYDDRIGEISIVDSVLFRPIRFRTNVSDSRSLGLESFVELDLFRLLGIQRKDRLSVFNNLSLMDAQYINSEESAFEGNAVELVPDIILKNGISYRNGGFRITYQFSYTSEHYTDATNADFEPNAVNGIIPDYYIMDLSAAYQIKRWTIESGLNNLTDNRYFSRRAAGYPGPGIIPSDGRSVYLTLGIKL